MMTDNGVCTVINVDAGNIYAKKEGIIKVLDQFSNFSKFTEVKNAEGAGLNKALKLILHSPSQIFDGVKYTGHYKISFNDHLNYFTNLETGVLVQIGYESTITVKPVKHTTTEAFNSLNLEDRKCRLPTEQNNTNSMFKKYTQRGCQLECALEKASQSVNCTPWNYPPFRKLNDSLNVYHLCDELFRYGEPTFQSEKVRFMNAKKECHCEDDCSGIVYQFEHSQTPLNVKKRCKGIYQYDPWYLPFSITRRKEFTEESALLWAYFGLDRSEGDLDLNTLDTTNIRKYMGSRTRECEEMGAEEYTVINIVLNSPQITKTEKNVKVTFSDQLGILGMNMNHRA